MGWVVNGTTRPLYPREKDRVPTVHENGWAQGELNENEKLRPPLGCDPRAVQPAAIHHKD
jgi:hypothetical protein